MEIKSTKHQQSEVILTGDNSFINFEELYTILWGKMLNTVCRKYTTDSDKAQDYCQNGFIKVYNNIHKYSNTGSLEGWVSCIINNSILDELKKGKVDIDDGGENGFDMSRIKSSEETCEELEYSISEIVGLLTYLPPSYKRAFEMYYLDGLRHNEIGEILGISVSTSKTNLMKSRNILKNYLINGVPYKIKNKKRIYEK
jgi:RNA polymerase sigma-70 factor (ECF subfamily)